MPLEPYAARYTEYLADIEREKLSKHFTVRPIEGLGKDTLPNDIKTGSVLDSIGRPVWAMNQMTELLSRPDGDDLGKIYFSDFYHTGLDALAYSGKKFKAFAFNWAQSWDIHDFTHKQHLQWMSKWEEMSLALYYNVFVASPLLKELMIAASPQIASTVHVVGLPFDSKQVRSLAELSDSYTPIAARHFDCVYSSRWDLEKNPAFFLAVVKRNRHLKFVVCTGRKDLMGTDTNAIAEAKQLESKGVLNIQRNLSKQDYFRILADSKVQFNCASQDWVSFTLLEALTFGCQPVYPSHRSFPETLYYSQAALYTPNDIQGAESRIRSVTSGYCDFLDTDKVLEYHDGTLDRIANIIKKA